MVKGWTPISVTDSLNDRLVDVYGSDERRPRNQKFSPWLNEVLRKFVEYQEDLVKYGAFIEYINSDGNKVLLYDNLADRQVTVYLDGDKKVLRCDAHGKKSDCLHVGFCFAIPDVYTILVKHGFKQPKEIDEDN